MRLLGIASLVDTWHDPSLPGQANCVRVPGCPQEEMERGMSPQNLPGLRFPPSSTTLSHHGPPCSVYLAEEMIEYLELPGVGFSELSPHVKVSCPELKMKPEGFFYGEEEAGMLITMTTPHPKSRHQLAATGK